MPRVHLLPQRMVVLHPPYSTDQPKNILKKFFEKSQFYDDFEKNVLKKRQMESWKPSKKRAKILRCNNLTSKKHSEQF